MVCQSESPMLDFSGIGLFNVRSWFRFP